MHSTLGRILIGVVVGVAGLMTLPKSTTRWPALAVWVIAWTLFFVAREARNDRRLAREAAARASLEATVAATERPADRLRPGGPDQSSSPAGA